MRLILKHLMKSVYFILAFIAPFRFIQTLLYLRRECLSLSWADLA